MDKLLYIPIFLPIIIAVLIYLINHDKMYFVIYIMELGIIGLNIAFFQIVDSGLVVNEMVGGWNQIIGISLKMARLEVVLLMLSSILFSLIMIYIQKSKNHDYKFLFFLLMLQGSFNGFVLSDDLFNIFVMLELITIISTILIIYKKDAYALKAGLYYLLFNSVGMIFFLTGIIMIYIKFGTLNLTYISSIIQTIDYDETLKFTVVLLFCGLAVKSAVFPVYDWLPKAHSASLTSISAILSGLLVKTGIIGLMKITLVFTQYNFSDTFFFLGMFTAFLGVIFAFSQKDIKQILSFHTVSQIGLIMVGFSININIAVLYLINHSFIKTLLFLDTGAIINQYKERRVNRINSVWINSPLLSVLLIIGALSLSGIPFTSGFISKATLAHDFYDPIKLSMLIMVNALTFASMLKILSILPGKRKFQFNISKRKYFSMILIAGIILITGIVFTDSYNGSAPIWSYFEFKTILKMLGELSLGFVIFKQLAKNELPIMKKIRHFSIAFPDGIILLTFFIFIVLLTFK